jgi:hypothetical protein
MDYHYAGRKEAFVARGGFKHTSPQAEQDHPLTFVYGLLGDADLCSDLRFRTRS